MVKEAVFSGEIVGKKRRKYVSFWLYMSLYESKNAICSASIDNIRFLCYTLKSILRNSFSTVRRFRGHLRDCRTVEKSSKKGGGEPFFFCF